MTNTMKRDDQKNIGEYRNADGDGEKFTVEIQIK